MEGRGDPLGTERPLSPARTSPVAVTPEGPPPPRFAEEVRDGIVLFDGECGLCNRWVDFVLRHEREPRLHFSPLQSPAGAELLRWAALPTEDFDTVVLIDGEGAHLRSTAALRVARHLRAPRSWLRLGMLVPRPLRDGVYGVIARRRLRWFGRRESCRVPTPDIRDRFLDSG